VLEYQLKTAEPLSDAEQRLCLTVNTEREQDIKMLADHIHKSLQQQYNRD
jgi:hypothetical protein